MNIKYDTLGVAGNPCSSCLPWGTPPTPQGSGDPDSLCAAPNSVWEMAFSGKSSLTGSLSGDSLTQPSPRPEAKAERLPGRHLVRHHDAVIRVGHQQPDGVLQDVLDELLAFLCDRMYFFFTIILRRVNASEILAGVTCVTAAFKNTEGGGSKPHSALHPVPGKWWQLRERILLRNTWEGLSRVFPILASPG